MKPHFKLPLLIILLVATIAVLNPNIASAKDLEQQSNFAAPVLIVNNSFLNVRLGPGADFGILTTVTGGTTLPVLAVAPDGVWYQVSTNFGPGWVNVTYTIARGSFANVPTGSAVTDIAGTTVNLGQGGVVAAPAPGSAIQPQPRATGVTMLGGDFRAEPSSTSALLRYVPERPNEIYPLLNTTISEGRPWYQANIPGVGVGWSDQFVLRPMVCAPGESIAVLTQGSNVLLEGVANPSGGYAAVQGAEGYVLSFEPGNLVRMAFPDGAVGLLSVDVTQGRSDDVVSFCDGVNPYRPSEIAAGVTPALAAPSNVPATSIELGQGGALAPAQITQAQFSQPSYQGPRVIVNTAYLNVRSGPGAEYNVVATVPGGTEVPVLAVMTDGFWYLVQGGFGTGWLSSEFVIFRGNYSQVPQYSYDEISLIPTDIAALGQGGAITSPNPTTLDQSNAGSIVQPQMRMIGVTMLGGDFRANPSSTAALVRFVPERPNEIYPLLNTAISEGRTWYQANIPGVGVGWSDRFVLRPMVCAPGESIAVLTQGSNVTIEGVANAGGYAAPQGAEGYVLSFEPGNLVRMAFPDGAVGLLSVDVTQGRSDDVVSFCDGVNPYRPSEIAAGVTPALAAPSTNLGQGGALPGSPEAQPQETAGFVPSGYQGPRVIVNTGNLNVRSGPSADFPVIATLAGGTELPLLGAASDGVWYLVEGSFGRGWLNNQFVIFRGNFNQVPILNLDGLPD